MFYRDSSSVHDYNPDQKAEASVEKNRDEIIKGF